MDWMVSDLDKHDINFKDIFYCPHHPDGVIEKYAINCSHRKPSPGMFLKARDIHNIDLKNSIVIGDKITDLQAGMKAGVGKGFLVNSGHHITNNDNKNYEVFKNLYEVSKSLKNK
jgi:D-glycero-D-manno-heptose 1,7-bisphosphate phosphatase